MRVLVTGGAGFIGSHFAKRLLAAGDDVRVLDKLTYSGNPANLEGTGIELVVGDICDPEAVAEAAAGCDAIVNFAAETHVDRSILGADRLRPDRVSSAPRCCSRTCARTGARFVQVSTDEVYGDLAGGRLVDRGRSARARRARTAPRRRAATCRCSATRAPTASTRSITRGSNTYGPNQYPEKLLPLFVTNALDGEPLPLYGDGKQMRDWLYVEDHCAGIELVAARGRAGEVYNVGGGDERENVEIVGHILELTGADESLVRHVEDRAGHDRRYSLDTTKLRERSAGRRRSRFDGGLRRDGRLVPRRTATGGSRSSPAVPRVLREAVRGPARGALSRSPVARSCALGLAAAQPRDLLPLAPAPAPSGRAGRARRRSGRARSG